MSSGGARLAIYRCADCGDWHMGNEQTPCDVPECAFSAAVAVRVDDRDASMCQVHAYVSLVRHDGQVVRQIKPEWAARLVAALREDGFVLQMIGPRFWVAR